jgi:hypothetical protein
MCRWKGQRRHLSRVWSCRRRPGIPGPSEAGWKTLGLASGYPADLAFSVDGVPSVNPGRQSKL